MEKVKPDASRAEGRSAPTTAVRGRRRAYRAPRLELFGDVRSLTLGGSPGNGDSVIIPPTFP